MGEIKSAIDVAQEHVDNINTEKAGFDSESNISREEQCNKPTDEMRHEIDALTFLCKDIGKRLSVDTGNVMTMAEEFEYWDQSGAAEK